MTDTPANESLNPEDQGSEAVITPGTGDTDPTAVTDSGPADDKAAIDTYGVNLGVFEGPLDLLLYLIRKSEVDIYDIPVARITAQYLAFLRGIHLLDLEGAADFILMAATLMKIKSQMLLPRDVEGEDLDEGIGDPREELVRKLLEYQQFKEIADWLGDQGTEQRDVYQRPGGLPEDTEDPELQPVSLFDLLKVYKHVIDHVPQAAVHRIVEEEVAIEECIERVLSELGQRSRLRFHELISGQSRVSMVATFIGILELLKSQRIRVHQAAPFDDIWIEGRSSDESQSGTETDEAADDEADSAAEASGVTPETTETGSTVVAEAVFHAGPSGSADPAPTSPMESGISGDDDEMSPVAASIAHGGITDDKPADTNSDSETETDIETIVGDEVTENTLIDDDAVAGTPNNEERPDDEESGARATDPADVSGDFESLTQSEFGSQRLVPPTVPGVDDGARDSTVSDTDGEDPPAQTALATPEPDDLEADASRLVDAAERLGDQAVPPAPGVDQTEAWEDDEVNDSPVEEDSQAAGTPAPPPPAPGIDGLTGPEERS